MTYHQCKDEQNTGSGVSLIGRVTNPEGPKEIREILEMFYPTNVEECLAIFGGFLGQNQDLLKGKPAIFEAILADEDIMVAQDAEDCEKSKSSIVSSTKDAINRSKIEHSQRLANFERIEKRLGEIKHGKYVLQTSELDRLKKLTWARKIQEMKKLESELLTVREEERLQDVVKRQAMAQRKKLGFFNTKEGYDLDYNP